ncbi:MAG: helix-hairpin-helix domain-containing protein [Deltaproteobacteria bacterium]|nr:helix-hairpin-helix domain-containing protein [Deltaproteobacteria bacterium]
MTGSSAEENTKDYGSFRFDLTRVHGIGEKTAERLDPWLEW